MPDDRPHEVTDLAAMIGSRICHDLISPVGAIANGVELLGMSGALPGPELALIADSVDNANARIRFFRIAFGYSSGGQSVGRAEIASILEEFYRGSRLKVAWLPSQDVLRHEVRLAFLALQCLESAMPYGGEVRVSLAEGQWMAVGEANKTKQDEDLWSPLETGKMPQVTANHVHFALLQEGVAKIGRALRIERVPERIVVTF